MEMKNDVKGDDVFFSLTMRGGFFNNMRFLKFFFNEEDSRFILFSFILLFTCKGFFWRKQNIH